jgi:hypothetical protein
MSQMVTSVCFGRAIGISLWPRRRGSGREFDDFDLRREALPDRCAKQLAVLQPFNAVWH